MERTLWSPSRVKSALQCGRRLQGSEEGWPRTDHINGVRGGVAHQAIEKWEASERVSPIRYLVVDAWEEKIRELNLTDDGVDPVAITDALSGLWDVAGEISFEEDVVAEKLAARYKAPRRTKAFEQQTAHLGEARKTLWKMRAELALMVDSVDWPWLHEKPVLEQGFEHSLETSERGAAFLTELYPHPDVIGAEWDLTSTLPNGYRVHGYIDRVEATPDGVEVVDYKSSEFQDTDLDHFIQIATYAVIAEDHLGFAPTKARLVFLRDKKSTAFKVQPSWRESLAALVMSADSVLARHAFAPSFAGCGICAYRPICEQEFALTPLLEEVA